VFLDKLAVAQIVKKFPVHYLTRTLLTVYKSSSQIHIPSQLIRVNSVLTRFFKILSRVYAEE
jgi:hypothetical protein